MSYRATAFKVKDLHLVLPKGFKIDEFIKRQTEHNRGLRIVVESNFHDWSYNEGGEGLSLIGVVTKKGLEVTKLKCVGVDSWHDYEDVLKPLFAQFKGDLVATIVWDSSEITTVNIDKGEITEKA